MTPLALVVARGRNGVIGAAGGLPWRQRTDLRRFKQTTLGKPVVMGRKTWDSLPGALAQRDNIVISRRGDFRPLGAWAFGSFETALACAQARAEACGADEVCVIGGEQIFRQSLERAARVYLTTIDASPEGDVVFPDLGPGWRETSAEDAPAGAHDDHAMRFAVWERV